jgi:hypothetical protein
MWSSRSAEYKLFERVDESGNGDSIWHFHHRFLTISDGQGGVLSLDLTQPGLDALAHTCEALLRGTLPPGACLMRVVVGEDTYLLRRVKQTPDSIGISRLGAPHQDVSLTADVLRLVVGVIQQSRSLRAPQASDPRGHAHDLG